MKIIRIIKKSFKDAFKSIFRNFSLSIASISCTAITLIIVALALLATFNVNKITKDIEDVLTIVVFVEKNATIDEVNEIEQTINGIKNVDKEKTVYKTQDVIKDELSEDDDLKAIFDILKDNPVQSSFVVKVKDVKQMDETADSIKKIKKVTKVKYGETLVNKLVKSFSVIRNACIVAVVALILVTAFLISNTIKITIFSRRNEISIMRLVGTSNTVIKMPFLIEGLVLGIIGAILPVLLTIYGYSFVYDYFGGSIAIKSIEFVNPSLIVYQSSLVLLIVGGVVGMFGSLRAVRRYLKI